MVDTEIVREWLAKADEDFEFARTNFEESKPFFAQICFTKDPSLEQLREDCEYLTTFYSTFANSKKT